MTVVHQSGNATVLSDIREEQVASVVDRYPGIHIFIEEDRNEDALP